MAIGKVDHWSKQLYFNTEVLQWYCKNYIILHNTAPHNTAYTAVVVAYTACTACFIHCVNYIYYLIPHKLPNTAHTVYESFFQTSQKKPYRGLKLNSTLVYKFIGRPGMETQPMRRSKMTRKGHFGGFKTYTIPWQKQYFAPSKITKAILLIKPVVFWDFVTRLASNLAKGTHPYSTSLMRFRDGAKTNFSHGTSNILAIATRGCRTRIKRRWLGSNLRCFHKKRFEIIQKALGLPLVSDAFSQNLKTLVLLRKRDGRIE